MNNLSKSLLLVTLLSLLSTSCAYKSIRVGDGATRNGPLATVNGRITIGNECTVTGESRTVNGRITAGDNSEVGELRTVNGSIRIGSNTSVNGDVSTINGRISCKSGSQVDGTLSTINGAITLTETAVTGSLITFNGNITLARGSNVQGDIVLRSRSDGTHRPKKPLVIKLSDSSVVEGDIINNDDRFEVQVIIDGDSKVLGEIKNAEVQR
ncbi:MAG: DUF4097 family beta strand repeat-containing protein [Planctomycetota bacterium]|jgi:DUF4097 and DUF4098 domain-containing protein YvlB